MDKIFCIIDIYALIDLAIFMLIGFFVLWLIGKVQDCKMNRKRKAWKRKNINWE